LQRIRYDVPPMETKLTAERRTDHGKGVARKLRAAGRIPAVLYGHGQETQSLSVDAHDMFKVLHTSAGANVLVDLKVDKHEHLVLPREIQRNHIKGTIVHVDFIVVSRTETIQVNVEILDVGEAPGVKQGGVVDHHMREVLVECFPQDVPEHLEADVSGLDLNDVLHVSDLVAPQGVTILTNPEETVLAVIVPAVLKTEADLTIAGEEPAVVEEPEAAEGEAVEGEGAPAEGEGEAASAEEGGEG
jgi:large subunit ribosomal protein L25